MTPYDTTKRGGAEDALGNITRYAETYASMAADPRTPAALVERQRALSIEYIDQAVDRVDEALRDDAHDAFVSVFSAAAALWHTRAKTHEEAYNLQEAVVRYAAIYRFTS